MSGARQRLRAVVTAACFTLVSATEAAHAQYAAALETGRLSHFDTGSLVLGVRLTPVRPDHLGVEGSMFTIPEAFSENVLLFSNLALVLPVPLGAAVRLTPRAGASVLAALSGGGGAVGIHAGIGVVARIAGPVGVRVDWTAYRFGLPGDRYPFTVQALTAGAVWVF